MQELGISMGETQWPRFEVFLQEKAGEPHVDVGSVHAVDAELALQNARDVFVRRPGCTSLWVCPVSNITALTRQELDGWSPKLAHVETTPEPYYVFCKYKSAGTAELAGEVQAVDPGNALAQALEAFSTDPAPFVWWVLPAKAVTQSTPEDIGPMFTPADDKPFRQSSYYHVITAMREARKEKSNEA